MEVVYLEQYLLTLYRKAFDQQISSVSPKTTDQKISSVSPTANQRPNSPSIAPRRLFVNEDGAETRKKVETSAVQLAAKTLSSTWKESDEYATGGKMLDSNVHRCHSTLSHRATLATKPSPDSLSKALRSCHSQPLSMAEVISRALSMASKFGLCCGLWGLSCVFFIKKKIIVYDLSQFLTQHNMHVLIIMMFLWAVRSFKCDKSCRASWYTYLRPCSRDT